MDDKDNNNSVILALKTALESKPDDDNLQLHLAQLYHAGQQFVEALHHFEAIIARQPGHNAALQGAAQCARELGDQGKAIAYEAIIGSADGDSPTSADNIAPPADSASRNAAEPVKLRVVEKDDNITQGPWEDFEPPITLADVGGMEAVKKRLNMAFLAPLKNPEMMKMYGKSLQGGLMLYGPPGCGKTFIARALAGELGASFMAVGLSDVLDMYIGESERKLHEIFEIARRNAPTVLFFDEVDALGQKRSNMRHSAGRTIVNQLLSEMDSIGNDNNNVFILAATNHPWDVDTALRRPGRLDRTVMVAPPDQAARASILQYHMRERPIEGIDFDELAARSEFYSGADLAHLCESASEFAMQDSIESGEVRPIGMQDFHNAMAEVRHSTRPWFDTARNFAMFANEGGTYDELLDYIQRHRL